MAPKIPNQKGKYAALARRMAKYILLVENIYDAHNLEASKIAVSTGHDGEKPFSFDDYPITKQRVEKLFDSWRKDMAVTIYSGTSAEWKESNLVQDLLADKVISYYWGKEHGKRKRKYYETNSEALQAFQRRRDRGMNLSDKIWLQSQQYRKELEDALSCGIQKGMSAVTLSKRVSKYLNDFPQLQKDYKAKYGRETQAINCEYRSMRLARTEINMAYRSAEQHRWQQMDFIVGFEVKKSKVHDDRMPDGDICDTLSEKKYPKDFKFVGWHPNCMCYVIPIMKTEDEFFEDDEDAPSVNEVKTYPKEMLGWIDKNMERIEGAAERGTLPYWLRDNPALLGKADVQTTQEIAITQEIPTTQGKSILERAQKRHAARSKDAADDIQYRWNKRKILRLYDEVNKGNLPEGVSSSLRVIEDSNELYDFDDAMRRISVLEAAAARHVARTPEQAVDIQRRWDASGTLEKITRPTPIYKPDNTRANVRDRLNHWADVLEEAYGDSKSRVVTVLRSIANNSFESVVKDNVKYIRRAYNDSDYTDVFSCINHLSELSKADLSCIPRRWKGKFNELIKKINANKSSDGYATVYSEIEHAYNIYQLSKSTAAVEYGLGKLSDKTPHQLFTEFRKKKPDYAIPKKEFFDKFDKFVPLQTSGKKKGESAYFSPRFKHVRINLKDEDNLRRLFNSKWYEDGLFYHEFGHAYADMKKMDDDAKVKDVFQKHKDIIAKDKGKAAEAALLKKLKEGKDRINKEFESSAAYKEYKELVDKMDKVKFLSDEYLKLRKKVSELKDGFLLPKRMDLEEELGGLSDTLMGMIEGARWIDPRGHSGKYFRAEKQQLHEFQAHCAENYWKGNKYFKELMPDLYEDMRKLWGDY